MELLIAVAIIGSIAAMTAPISGGMIDDIRLRGDAQGVSGAIARTKLTGAAQFTRARLRINAAAGTFQIETWRSTGVPGWQPEGGLQRLSHGGRFDAGPVTTPPPDSQAVFGPPASCLNDEGAPIAGTSCITFNSRGLPIAADGSPVTTQVIYMRGPTGVFAVVIGATGRLQVWRTTLSSGGSWRQQ